VLAFRGTAYLALPGESYNLLHAQSAREQYREPTGAPTRAGREEKYIQFIGIRFSTQCDSVTRCYGDHSPVTTNFCVPFTELRDVYY
jgi:hypothetical protein